MATRQVDLANVFGTVASTLASNREVLNKADTINHDHGDNMVEVFEVVAQAMKAKKGASSADQLAYAAELLRQKQSGSAKYYAGGLTQAAQKYQGKKITSTNAMVLIQTLLGGGVQSSAGTSTSTSTSQPDLLSTLLGGLGGTSSQSTSSGQTGLDIGSLLNAGMSYMSAKQRGETDATALMGALTAATSGGNTPYRAQSGALVANTLMQALGSLASKK
ncbi:MAG: hypothetical protein NTU91_01520 [Chloroflexi bacterium]|nr:hypothetical protein [Chloroflexota bacterium]